ncbi:MAG: GNAT family N-acetyltransferase [Aeromicrobium sp.]
MLRNLGPEDVPQLRELIAVDPLINLFVDYRVEMTHMLPRWIGGSIWGYFESGTLVSACHAASNLIPVEASTAAIEAFAEHALRTHTTCSSIVGPQEAVLGLWDVLEPHWGPARSPRLAQPFMTMERDSLIEPDERVRRVVMDEFEMLYPACVAMFTEEVGLDPEATSKTGYRARIAQLISQGWSFAIIEDGEVLFKAEIGAATARGCQIQGVYVAPKLRGQGMAANALASVVNMARSTIAPSVTLYVNDHNLAARRTYDRVGFVQTATFATILL